MIFFSSNERPDKVLPAQYDKERLVKTTTFGRACNFILVKTK